MVPGLWLSLLRLLTTGMKKWGKNWKKCHLADFENSEYVDKNLTEFSLQESIKYMENLHQDINDTTVF